MVEQLSWLQLISKQLGFPEIVVRFLLCFISAYPLAFVYRLVIRRQKPWIQHIYSTVSGLYLCYFIFGTGCVHSFINIVGMYYVLQICGPTAQTVALSFVLNMGYLYIGFYYRVMDEFMIDWSVPHCVLCLRLIGLAWDYYDGNNYNNNLSDEMKQTNIKEPPSLLEMLGYCYFFASVLAGPQFPIRRYRAMVEGTLTEKGVSESSCVREGLRRMCLGLLYCIPFAVLNSTYSANHLMSDWFEEISFLHRIWFITWFGKVTWCKYLALFLLSEGSCIIAGLGYNGKNEDGQPQWDGVANMKVIRYEKSLSVLQVIQSFHLQTSLWLVRYVYKRLKFIGNRTVSLAISATFLAVWHGYMPGYFCLFILQFFYIVFEKSVFSCWQAMGGKSVYELPVATQVFLIPAMYLMKQFALSYGIIPLVLLHFHKFDKVFRLVYYGPLPLIITWDVFLYPLIINPLIRSAQKTSCVKKVE